MPFLYRPMYRDYESGYPRVGDKYLCLGLRDKEYVIKNTKYVNGISVQLHIDDLDVGMIPNHLKEDVAFLRRYPKFKNCPKIHIKEDWHIWRLSYTEGVANQHVVSANLMLIRKSSNKGWILVPKRIVTKDDFRRFTVSETETFWEIESDRWWL